MTQRNVFYYSKYAASEFGYQIAETPTGEKFKFTHQQDENAPLDYDFTDKKIVGIHEVSDLKIGERIIPTRSNSITPREQIEKALEIQNAGKTPEQVLQASYEYHKDLIQQEKNQKKKDANERLEALRAIYNACFSKPSSRFKK